MTTDAGLRVEYLDDRIYAVPAAHDQLDWTPLGGYPHLGFLVRFGEVTIYRAGACVSISNRRKAAPLKRYGTLAPGGGPPDGFEIAEAEQLGEDVGASWLVPLSSTPTHIDRFIDHMLGSRPAQAFKVFGCGERWAIPGK